MKAEGDCKISIEKIVRRYVERKTILWQYGDFLALEYRVRFCCFFAFNPMSFELLISDNYIRLTPPAFHPQLSFPVLIFFSSRLRSFLEAR